jgi:hypothetical protein
MRIAIISRHSIPNYGSLFQAYALQIVIEKLGYDAIHIDYTPYSEQGARKAITTVNRCRWNKNLATKALYILYQIPSCCLCFKRFTKYRHRLLHQTSIHYSSKEDLLSNPPQAEIFVTGSDQVWNIIADGKMDENYYLGFLPNESYRISYAASFGTEKFNCEDEAHYKELLKKYRYISVREDSGINILNEFGLDGTHVLDPTLLAGKEIWEQMANPKRIIEKKYILIYQLKPNKEFDSFAKHLAVTKGYSLIRVSTMLSQITMKGRFYYMPTPTNFLSLFRDAEYILTDSFHGTCISLLFEKQFAEVLPGIYNSRNISLLRALQLEKRILYDMKDISIIDDKIDYNKTKKILEGQRNKSMDFLKKAIEGFFTSPIKNGDATNQ